MFANGGCFVKLNNPLCFLVDKEYGYGKMSAK